ncbi:TatD family hydrolase [Candidatus Babeliales bacterium]|nr:TatD family hydrolase [Candidatus Babeliales bacterium]
MTSSSFLIDTHAHLNMLIPGKVRDREITNQEIRDLKNYVENARNANVNLIINVGTSYIESINSIAIAKEYNSIYATVGIHPCDVDDAPWKDSLDQLAKLLPQAAEHKIVGIGETGLDFYHKPFDATIQKDAFAAHLDLSIQYNLPVVIHVREAADATLDVLKSYAGKVRGVIHCFAQSYDFAKQVLDWGLVLGIDAPITYPKNNLLREVVEKVPLDSLILETDSPFLPPQKFRGKKNEPAHLTYVVDEIARIKQCSNEKVIETTMNATLNLFSLV